MNPSPQFMLALLPVMWPGASFGFCVAVTPYQLSIEQPYVQACAGRSWFTNGHHATIIT
jgi:hypothetical protein